MRQYQALNCEPKLNIDINNCSWPQVFKLLETVQENYTAKAQKGLMGSLRRMGRGVGENSDEIEQILSMIPEEFGGCVIRAGLSWMFIVCKVSLRGAHTENVNLILIRLDCETMHTRASRDLRALCRYPMDYQ